ncbi:MAG TPA: TerC family protein [Alphaproteobacteria bacterium]|jgi:YjbE family integral membrane protein|nr:TerC family protein [Alphaproteobacteria bacterium]
MELVPHFWVALGSIIVVNIILSGDNAVVIALASRNLPHKLRNKAIVLGSAGAIVLRIIFCLFVATLMAIPYLKLVGSALLLWIGVKLLVPEEEGDEENGTAAPAGMWAAIRTIIIADAVMSLDNAIAIAAAAQNDYLLITLGLIISIPLIIFGSQLILKIMGRFPVIITVGAALIGWIAGDVGITDPAVRDYVEPYGHFVDYGAKVGGAALVVLLGKVFAARAQRRRVTDLELEHHS